VSETNDACQVEDIGLAKDTIFTSATAPAARSRYVYYPDHLVRLPHPAFGLFKNLYTIATEEALAGLVTGLLGEPFRDPRDETMPDESIGDFLSRRFNKTIVDRLVSAVIHGIYAGDVWKLSAKSLFARAWRDEAVESSIITGLVRGRAEGIPMPEHDADFQMKLRKITWDPAFKRVVAGSSVFTFNEGSQMLADRLAEYLIGTGRVTFAMESPVHAISAPPGQDAVEVRLKSAAGPSRTHSHVVSALSPAHLNQVWAGPSALVPHIPTVNVMTVNLYYRTPNLHPPGFGYLIPQATPFEQNPERALGVVFDTAYAPDPASAASSALSLDTSVFGDSRYKHLSSTGDFTWLNSTDKPGVQDLVQERGTKLTVMLGGHWWDGWDAFPNEQEGLALAKSLLERQLGIKEEPEVWRVNMQKDCIPQYVVGHTAKLKEAHNNISREFSGRLKVTGNWMAGVGVNDCIRSAYELSRSFDQGGTGLELVDAPFTNRIKAVPRGAQRESES
jgi:oxygen-dependent protoporphyrinogen oxidase